MKLTKQELERIEREILGYSPETQQRYYNMVANGQGPRFALMCACQQAPMTRQTDRTFNAERQQVMSEMRPKQRDAYLGAAKAAGIATQGKYYVGALGRPTDPMAWVSTVDDAKAVCREKNLTASGIVEHKGTPMPPKKKRMAKDIRDNLVKKQLQADPALAERCAKNPACMKKVQSEVVDRYSKPGTD